MFSAEILAVIAKTAFKVDTIYQEFITANVTPFDIPCSNTIDVHHGDSVHSIKEKIMQVENNRHELWFNGLITDTKGKINYFSTHNTIAAIRQLQDPMVDILPIKVKMMLIGLKDTPSEGMHPKYAEAVFQNKIRLPKNYRVYNGGQKMVETCFILEVGKTSKVYTMASGVSNFNEIPNGPVTLAEFGVVVNPVSWKYDVVTSEINAVEKLIQIFKCAAQKGTTYMVTDLEEIKKKLTERIQLLKSFGESAIETDDLLELNKDISNKMMEIMRVCVDAKKQKQLGRGALINGKEYFPQMDGKAFNPDAPNFEEVGVNAVFMAVGTMIRIFKGDEQVISFTEISREFDVMILEGAVHVTVERKTSDDKKIDITFGADPDGAWGSSFAYQRESPDFDEVTAFSELKENKENPKEVTGYKQRKTNGAFGAGIALVMAARFNGDALGKAARKRLGVNEDILMKIDRETIRIVAQAMMDSIKE